MSNRYKVYKINREGQLRFWKSFPHFPEALLDDPDFSSKYKIEIDV